ncbi:aminopeptidase N-like [Achroia grisella]|uniref:aminopeptidase N-like n=1 Tax=Achroia grisella TaxID=688607 RepID=UPI0027D2F595|nr:aminopeptidase N-like [Achroia grisella]
MVRRKLQWKLALFFYLILLNVFTKSLPIDKTILESTTVSDTAFNSLPILEIPTDVPLRSNVVTNVQVQNATATERNITRNIIVSEVRPGQNAAAYSIELNFDGDSFEGRAIINVLLRDDTLEDEILLHAEDITVNSVVKILDNSQLIPLDYTEDDGILEISVPDNLIATRHNLHIEYSGSFESNGHGLHLGEYGGNSYVAMNLYPTHARRVFPCMDELTQRPNISFSFNGLDYNNIVTNSMPQQNSQTQFRGLTGTPHSWGMMAHNFDFLVTPHTNVQIFGRPNLQGVQHDQASVAISSYFSFLNEWTNRNYFDIVFEQDGRMLIFILPDISTDWYSLSIVGLWEGYVFMENTHSIKQRRIALVKIAEAMASQWFGYLIYPNNWRNQWIISGFASYAAWEAVYSFQTSSSDNDITMLDVNTLFVTEVIQESLLLDSYASSQVLEPEESLFDEVEIRDHINGLVKLKTPAIFRMLRLILGDEEDDFIHRAAQSIVTKEPLTAVISRDFYDAVVTNWFQAGKDLIESISDYMETWLHNSGYPVVHVTLRSGGVFLTQERFAFTNVEQIEYPIPITYATSLNPDFEDENVYPNLMLEQSLSLDVAMEDEGWILFNIQGQGYYRVNYADELWEHIIEALDDPERREEIHPLNRATLIDDALNLARAGKLSYDIALELVLTMEHETEYAVWKAFVRNMDFLRKRLTALVLDDEDLDQDIYLRMVRRTVGLVEDELSFYPDTRTSEGSMVSLTRGLVMDHACRANYDPCIAAAVDWFYDSDGEVNPDIPYDIRPAVYCTMVREGDDDVIEALQDRLEIERTMYERVVILESLGCSQDEDFINSLLDETISNNSPYSIEERSKIFAAVASASYDNAFIAMNFMSRRTNDIREKYGGSEKLEELIFILADNMANQELSTEFQIWVNSVLSNLDDSEDIARRALEMVITHLTWDQQHLEDVYEWIDENDARTLTASLFVLVTTLCIAFLQH